LNKDQVEINSNKRAILFMVYYVPVLSRKNRGRYFWHRTSYGNPLEPPFLKLTWQDIYHSANLLISVPLPVSKRQSPSCGVVQDRWKKRFPHRWCVPGWGIARGLPGDITSWSPKSILIEIRVEHAPILWSARRRRDPQSPRTTETEMYKTAWFRILSQIKLSR